MIFLYSNELNLVKLLQLPHVQLKYYFLPQTIQDGLNLHFAIPATRESFFKSSSHISIALSFRSDKDYVFIDIYMILLPATSIGTNVYIFSRVTQPKTLIL